MLQLKLKLDIDALFIEINVFACSVSFFFRSKLGLFQSRISLQKASVKVRGLTHKDAHTTTSLPLKAELSRLF